jgi:ketosteroid isomerase-like protein
MPETENETAAWVAQLFTTVDAMQPEAAAAYFTDDAVFRFGNAPPAHGREAIRQALTGFFDMIGGLHHHVTGVWRGQWEHGQVLAVEAEVTYTRQDGSQTPPLPVTSTLRSVDGRIQDYRIFMDPSPLFAAPERDAVGT